MKPKEDDIYYYPALDTHFLYKSAYWHSDCLESKRRYDIGIVCKTEYQAIRLAKAMIKKIQEIRNES